MKKLILCALAFLSLKAETPTASETAEAKKKPSYLTVLAQRLSKAGAVIGALASTPEAQKIAAELQKEIAKKSPGLAQATQAGGLLVTTIYGEQQKIAAEKKKAADELAELERLAAEKKAAEERARLKEAELARGTARAIRLQPSEAKPSAVTPAPEKAEGRQFRVIRRS